MVDSIKITALQDIGANIAYTTLVPVVNMAGTPITQKSNLQNLGNLILNGAGGSYFPRAAQANLALSVANAAQPNITSVGTLTSLAVTGNITAGNVNGGNIVVANFYYGDGGFLTNVSAGSNYSNSNVANYLPTYTGNVGANWVIATYFSGNGHNLTFLPGANVQGTVANAAYAANAEAANTATTATSATTAGTVTTAAQPNITSVGALSTLNVSGNATISGNLTVDGNLIYVNVETLSVVDPIIDLQTGPNGAPPAANSGKDVGTALNYYDTQARVAFMGWDVSNAEFGMASQATLANEVVTFNQYGNLRVGNIIGNGQALSGIAGANVSGEVGFAAVANSVAGGNVTGAVSSATTATTAGTVTTNAQPNITSVGTLSNLSVTGNVSANYFVGVATDVSVEAVNNNYSYHMAFVTGSGDTTLHMDNDDNLQYNPQEGLMTVNRVDMGYLSVSQSVISNLNPFSNVTQDLGNNTNRWKDIWLANSTIHMGDATISANGNSIVVDSITVTNGNVGTVGNVASLNLDGSSSNVLYGNGVFAPASGGGNANVGNFVFANTTMSTPDEDVMLIQTSDNNSNLRTQMNFNPNLGLARMAARSAENNTNYTNTSWTIGEYTGTQVNFVDAPALVAFLETGSWNSGVNKTFSINGGNRLTYTGYSAGGNNATVYTDVTASPDPTIVTSIDFYYQLESKFDIDYDDGSMNINSTGMSIYIDNDQTQGPDIWLRSGDDITIQAKDKTLGSESEGGDINIYAGDGAGDDGLGNLSSSGGDLQIYAGTGGSGSSGSGSQGGTARFRAGEGGGSGVTDVAGQGGFVEIWAGAGGPNNGNSELGAIGGYVDILAGTTTLANNVGGNVSIRSGEGGNNAIAGDVQIITPASGPGGGGTWTFDGNGLLTLPSGNTKIGTQYGSEAILASNASFGVATQGNATTFINWSDDVSNTSMLAAIYVNDPTGNAGNISVRTGNVGNANVWKFVTDGSVIFPTLTVDIHNGGNQQAQTLQFGDPTQQAIITGPTPAPDTAAQRLIIQGQRGNGLGEGGDVYLWAGDAEFNGGDIKIYAGDADDLTSGSGGYINLDGGSGFNGGGQISITGGYSSGGQGGTTSLSGGQGATDGGAVNINGGGGSTAQGGNIALQGGYGGNNGGEVRLTGGSAGTGIPGYGNVVLVSGASTWTFDNNGNLVLAGGNSVIQSIANSSLDPLNPNVSTMTLTPDPNYNSQILVLDPTAPGHIHLRAYCFSNIDEPAANIFLGGEDTAFEITQGANNVAKIHSGSNTWTFGTDGNLVTPGLTGTYIKSAPGGYMGLAAMDDGGDQPAQLVSINSNSGLGTTAISAYANNALIQANINGDIKSWNFDNTGNLTLPGNTFAVNYANGTQVSLGGGLPLSNGTSNIDIATSNGNVTITANGTSTWTFDTAGNLNTPGSLLPSSNGNYDLGSNANRWRDLYLSGNTIYLGPNVTLQSSDDDLLLGTPNIDLTFGGGAFTMANSANANNTFSIALFDDGADILVNGNVGGNLTFGGGAFVLESASLNFANANGNILGNILLADDDILINTGPGGNLVFTGGAFVANTTDLRIGNTPSAIVVPVGVPSPVATKFSVVDGTFQQGNGDMWTDGFLYAANGLYTGNGLLLTSGNINFSNGSQSLIAYGANNYINMNNDGGMDLSCNTEVKITTNYGDAPNRAYSYFYANGTFSAGGNIVTSANVSGNVGLFNDLNLNNLGTNAFLYTDSNRNIYDTQFDYDSATDTMSGGNISLTGNISANNLGNISVINTDGNASNVLYGNGVFASSPGVGGANTQLQFNDAGVANGSANLTFDKSTSTFTVTGNASVSGSGSNIVRRAFGLVPADTTVTLDDLSVTVSSSTNQLTLSTSGSWQGTGWTETFAGGGTPTVNNWVNLPLNPGFNNASGAMNSQGNGCRCVISDQSPSAKVYQITVVRSGTTGAQWNISIERLV